MTDSEQLAALRKENAELRAELEELYKEPAWFSHAGDYLVIVAVLIILAFGVFYAHKII